MNYRERVVIDSAVRSGKPIVKGTRITVFDVLDYLSSGTSETEILSDFPQLERQDILACKHYVAANSS